MLFSSSLRDPTTLSSIKFQTFMSGPSAIFPPGEGTVFLIICIEGYTWNCPNERLMNCTDSEWTTLNQCAGNFDCQGVYDLKIWV